MSSQGYPRHRQTLAALSDLMQYVGGWDSPPDHPCAKAAKILEQAEAAGWKPPEDSV
jgi:hypothetical protein